MRRLYTTDGEALTGMPWQDYPRPQMVRENWLCLNGDWAVFTDSAEASPIRVPFCAESMLSGMADKEYVGMELRYRKRFVVPKQWRKKRILLHFGAVNRRAEILLNGKSLAVHENGFLPFTVELTEHLRPGKNELVVRTVNDLDPRYPWGKQKQRRGGIWYTPCSGIWQTVWLEPVPREYIHSLTIKTGLDWVQVSAEGVREGTVTLNGNEYPLDARIQVEHPVFWSPENPHLYRFTVTSGADRVESYFALRTLTVEPAGGVPRLCLNGNPYFFNGLLDQGYWSDGLYTPPTPECYEKDILAMKALGFNTLRKHIKIEPERFYYDCDRLGMVVFQDMVNNGEYSFFRDSLLPTLGFRKRNDTGGKEDPEIREQFLEAMRETVRTLRNHPSICLWTIFNEGWGQSHADEAYRELKKLDPSRYVDATSGWFWQKESDVESRHIYFRKLRTRKMGTRPLILSEFGGYVWESPEHPFHPGRGFGYRKLKSREEYVAALRTLYETQLLPMTERGLSAAVYTQVSDVEDEVNGLLTFDRAEQKVQPEEILDLMARLKI